MTDYPDNFADAEAGFDDAKAVIFGVPYDGTVSHRAGAKAAPAAIRHESYNFETYLYEYGIELAEIAVHDAGDLTFPNGTTAALDKTREFIKSIAAANRFPVMLGGEHSLTIGAVKGLLEIIKSGTSPPPFGAVVIDAHLDYRDEYEGERYSHACVTRRLTELLGAKNVIVIGVRSMSLEEHQMASEHNLKFYDVNTLRDLEPKLLIEDILELLGGRPVYLSLDMDAIDPAYAPGVGNPEPFGLTAEYVNGCIEALAPNLVGFDLMEVSPKYDNGNTASLAARLIRNTIALKAKSEARNPNL